MEKYPGVLPVTQGMSLPQHVVGLCSGCAWPNPAHLLVRSGALMGTSIFLMEARPSTSPWKGRGGCFSAGIRETEIVILVLLECPGLSECSCAPCAHAGLEAGVDQETLVFSNCPGCLLRFSSWFFLFVYFFVFCAFRRKFSVAPSYLPPVACLGPPTIRGTTQMQQLPHGH